MADSDPTYAEKNLYLNKLKVFFYNIIIVGFQTGTTIQIPKQYALTYETAMKSNNPLILLLVPDAKAQLVHQHTNPRPVQIGPNHAVVMVPGDGVGVAPYIYDNHYPERSSYTITNIEITGPMIQRTSATFLSRIVSLISEYVSLVIQVPAGVTEVAVEAFKHIEYHPELYEIFNAKDRAPIQTKFQDLAPGEGVCLYSALMIYIELMKKKRLGLLPQLTTPEIDALKSTCSEAKFEAEKIEFFQYVLLPQVESYKRPSGGTESLPPRRPAASGAAAARPKIKRADTMGGKKKTKRKSKTKGKMKNKKRKNRRKTKRRRKRKSRK